jgi:hypothetical protein
MINLLLATTATHDTSAKVVRERTVLGVVEPPDPGVPGVVEKP